MVRRNWVDHAFRCAYPSLQALKHLSKRSGNLKRKACCKLTESQEAEGLTARASLDSQQERAESSAASEEHEANTCSKNAVGYYGPVFHEFAAEAQHSYSWQDQPKKWEAKIPAATLIPVAKRAGSAKVELRS